MFFYDNLGGKTRRKIRDYEDNIFVQEMKSICLSPSHSVLLKFDSFLAKMKNL